ncbi:MAG: cupredoxin domain-containing protein [Actinobacteria bacterium]|nr:cupredoxin domain-containing protein [Actinomycetota bacterium]
MVARRTGSLLLALLLLLAVLTASAADARRRPPTTSVGVAAREFRFSAYRTSAPGGIVRFNVANFGEDGHDLVVETAGGRRVGRTGEVRSGRRATLALRLRPGTYRLVCDLADHAARGMRTSFRVTR